MKKTVSTFAAIFALGLGFGPCAQGAQQGKVTLPDGSSIDRSELQLPAGFRPAMAQDVINSTFTPMAEAAPRAAQQTNSPFGKYFDYNVADDHVNFFTFKLAGQGGMFRRGFMHSTTAAPSERQMLCEWPHLEDSGWDAGEWIVTAATMVGDELWAYVCESWVAGMSYGPVGIYKINLETGRAEMNPVVDDSNNYDYNNHVSELSYDPSTGYLYAMRNKASGWCGLEVELDRTIERLDVNSPSQGWEEVGSIDHAFTMAADEGYIYFIQGDFAATTDEDGNPVQDLVGCSLRKINSDDYASFAQDDLELVGKINSGFLKINYLQSMEFDHSDHTLWWHGAKYDDAGTPFVTRLDTETAETDDPLETVNLVTSQVGMAIPYEYVDKGAAHYVRNLSVITGAQGVAEATFSWTNPTLNSMRKSLDGLTAVRVYRDGELYATLNDVQAGQQTTWSDEGQSSGVHVYRFVPVNSHGEGLSRQRSIFVGHDVPKAPADLTVQAQGTTATISWTAPVVGVNGGWIDKSTLTYDVVRMPDNKKVATGISETTCTDESSRYMGYTYVVTPATADGKGEAATSSVVAFGPAIDVPYINELNSASDANMLTLVDGNKDGYTFEYDITPAELGVYGLWMQSTASQADEWVILPELNFESGKQYKILVRYAVSNYKDKKEKFEIRQGASNNPEAQTNLLDTWEVETAYGEYEDNLAFVTDASKGNYLSIRLASDPDQGWVVLRRIEVREYGTKDASLVDFDGPSVAFTQGTNKYNVTVKNEGRSAMRGAVAQLITYPQGEVLAEASVPATKVGNTSSVVVEWQPAAVGTYKVSARVQLDGDVYEDDNITDHFITVEAQEGKPSEWKEVLTRDNTGYPPFYTTMGWSQVETIYTAEEIGLQDVTFTGISYGYDPADGYDSGLTEMPVEIYLAETDRTTLSRYDSEKGDYYGDMFPENIFTTCFKGVVNMGGRQSKNDLTMMFTTPFYFEGTKNLVVRNVNANEASTKQCNYWHIVNEMYKQLKDCRSARYNPGQEVPVKLNGQVAVIKLAYKEGRLESGVDKVCDGFVTLGAGAYVQGQDICFAETQDLIQVFDASGRKVAAVKNASKVSSLAKGVYVVTGRKGNNIMSNKVIIR